MKGKDLGHLSISGTTVVPANGNGERKCGDLDFHGYNANEDYICTRANYKNHLPDSRCGKLDEMLLKKHGLTIKQVKSCNALFLFNCYTQFTSQSYLTWNTTKDCHSFQ